MVELKLLQTALMRVISPKWRTASDAQLILAALAASPGQAFA